MGDGMDFRCLPDLFVRGEPAFRIDQVGREERVDQRRFSQTSLTCETKQHSRQKPREVQHSRLWQCSEGIHTNDNDIELETSFQELVLNLTRDRLETNVGVGANLFSLYL